MINARAEERLDPKNADLDVRLVRQHLARYAFASTFVTGRTVLDVACGTGYGASLLKEAGAQMVYGVDISPEAIEFAAQAYGGESVVFEIGDAENLELPCPFDVITSFETIEHVDHPSDLLRGVTRHLAPGGVFCVSTPVRQAGSLDDTPPNQFHRREWKEKEFRALLEQFFLDVSVYGQYELVKRWFPLSRTLQRRVLRMFQPALVSELDRYEVRSTPPTTPSHFPCVMAYVVTVCRNPR